MGEYPGGDTVGIVTRVSSGAVDKLGQPITTETVAWVYGCVFGTQHTTEDQDEATTSRERAWVWLPYLDGLGIPTVNADGTPALNPDGTQTCVLIDNNARIRPRRSDPMGSRDYKVYGMPAVEYDLDGVADHLWVTCEWQA